MNNKCRRFSIEPTYLNFTSVAKYEAIKLIKIVAIKRCANSLLQILRLVIRSKWKIRKLEKARKIDWRLWLAFLVLTLQRTNRYMRKYSQRLTSNPQMLHVCNQSLSNSTNPTLFESLNACVYVFIVKFLFMCEKLMKIMYPRTVGDSLTNDNSTPTPPPPYRAPRSLSACLSVLIWPSHTSPLSGPPLVLNKGSYGGQDLWYPNIPGG